MARIEWTEDLNTGIDEIDQQHQRIVDYINALDDARKKDDIKKIAQVIDDTVDYTISHFGFEESMLEDAGYNLLRPHKKVHELFIKRISDMQKRFKAGEDVSQELHNLLGRWLIGHIKHDDYAYRDCVKKYLKIDDRTSQKKTWMERFFGL